MYSFTRLFTATLYHDTVRMYVNLFIFSAVFFALFTPADRGMGWYPIKTGGQSYYSQACAAKGIWSKAPNGKQKSGT